MPKAEPKTEKPHMLPYMVELEIETLEVMFEDLLFETSVITERVRLIFDSLLGREEEWADDEPHEGYQ